MSLTDPDRLVCGLPVDEFDTLRLRDQFLRLVEANRRGLDPDERDRMRVLSGRLWNSSHVLPREACDDLELSSGSTYAQAARAWGRRTS